MKKIEAIIQPFRIDQVKQALIDLGVNGMTVSDVCGHGQQQGHTEVYRRQEYIVELLPKTKVEVVVLGDVSGAVINAIRAAACTGKFGDGKIFVYDIADVIRIRNGDRGLQAL